MKKVIIFIIMTFLCLSIFGCSDNLEDYTKERDKAIQFFSKYESGDKVALAHVNEACAYYDNGELKTDNYSGKTYTLYEVHKTYYVMQSASNYYKVDHDITVLEQINYTPISTKYSYRKAGEYRKEHFIITNDQTKESISVYLSDVFTQIDFGELNKSYFYLHSFCCYEDELFISLGQCGICIVLKYDFSLNKLIFYSLLYGDYVDMSGGDAIFYICPD